MSTYFISTTGSDATGNGTTGSPYLTISKALSVCNSGDIIKLIAGTYTITSTINITKNITLTSQSGSGVILDSNCTIFNIQSNTTISYITMQTSNSNALVTIDIMSDGTSIPTYFTTNIAYCNIKYVTNGIIANGIFNINNNQFSRMSGTNTATVIKVYTYRTDSSISSNTFTDVGNVAYFVSLTSNGNDISKYYDYCNSKGGQLLINSNTVNYSGTSTCSFVFINYFNQYTSSDSNYNYNTKIQLVVTNNTITYDKSDNKFIEYFLSNGNDLNSINKSLINGNNISNTNYGIIHINKNINGKTITISNLSGNLFKIYNNVSNTVIPMDPILSHFDARVSSRCLNASGNPISDYTTIVNNVLYSYDGLSHASTNLINSVKVTSTLKNINGRALLLYDTFTAANYTNITTANDFTLYYRLTGGGAYSSFSIDLAFVRITGGSSKYNNSFYMCPYNVQSSDTYTPGGLNKLIWGAIVFTASNNGMKWWKNSTSTYSSSTVVPSLPRNIQMMCGGTGQCLNEVILYSKAHSDATVSSNLSIFNTRWSSYPETLPSDQLDTTQYLANT